MQFFNPWKHLLKWYLLILISGWHLRGIQKRKVNLRFYGVCEGIPSVGHGVYVGASCHHQRQILRCEASIAHKTWVWFYALLINEILIVVHDIIAIVIRAMPIKKIRKFISSLLNVAVASWLILFGFKVTCESKSIYIFLISLVNQKFKY